MQWINDYLCGLMHGMKTKLELGKSVCRLVDDSFFSSLYSEVYNSPVNKSVKLSLRISVRSLVRIPIDESLIWRIEL